MFDLQLSNCTLLNQTENEKLLKHTSELESGSVELRENVEGLTQRLKALELESNNAKQTVAMLNGELHDQSIQTEK